MMANIGWTILLWLFALAMMGDVVLGIVLALFGRL